MAPHSVLTPLDVTRPDSTTPSSRTTSSPCDFKMAGQTRVGLRHYLLFHRRQMQRAIVRNILRNYTTPGTRGSRISATTMVSYKQQIPQEIDEIRSGRHHSINLYPQLTQVSSQRILRLTCCCCMFSAFHLDHALHGVIHSIWCPSRSLLLALRASRQ